MNFEDDDVVREADGRECEEVMSEWRVDVLELWWWRDRDRVDVVGEEDC